MLYQVSFEKNTVCQCRLIDAPSAATARSYFEEQEPAATLYGVSEHSGMIKPGMPVDRVPDGWEPTNTAGTAEESKDAAQNLQPIMDRLTALKAESMAENDPFGQSPADREIKAIAATLAAFGVQWYYTTDSAGKWVATLK